MPASSVPVHDATARVGERLSRLATQSVRGYYNAYTAFEWPRDLPDGQYWLNPELLTVYDTPWFTNLEPRALHLLSKWESINFYSLNVHGSIGGDRLSAGASPSASTAGSTR